MSLNNEYNKYRTLCRKKFDDNIHPHYLIYLLIGIFLISIFLAAVEFLYMYLLTTIKFTYTQKYLYEVAIGFVFQYSKDQPHSQGPGYEYSQDFQGYNCWIRYTPSFISQGIFFPYIKTNINYWYLNNITYICCTFYLFILKKKVAFEIWVLKSLLSKGEIKFLLV